MAEESETGPTRRRAGSQRADVHTIERASPDQARTSASSSRRGGTVEDARVRNAEPSVTPFPQRVARKYYVMQASHGADERRVYADEHGEYLVFKDEGHRLTTRRHETAIVRDLIAVAFHRDWSALRVSGTEAFRREVWLEASARSITVSGYAPSQLDWAALARREDRRPKNDRSEDSRSLAGDRTSERDPTRIPGDRDTATRQSSDASARARDVDVAGLRIARTDDDASERRRRDAVGDQDGFRGLPLGRATADSNLAAGRSHIAVLDHALRRAFPDNAAVREVVLLAARERVILHLNQGRTLHRATYRVPTQNKLSKSPENSEINASVRNDARLYSENNKEH